MNFRDSNDTLIWIFNVGRGNAAFLRTPTNHGIILDMAGSSEFSPADFVRQKLLHQLDSYSEHRIAQAVLSHPHTDHISECHHLLSSDLSTKLITCPHDKDPKESVNWSRIKNIDGQKSLEKYRSLYERRTPPLQTIEYKSSRRPVSHFEYGIYYLRPPVCDRLHSDDNAYGNATSIVSYFRYGNNSILFPGDITPEAMERILVQSEGVEKRFTIFSSEAQRANVDWHLATGSQPTLQSRLRDYGLSILAAPHHGLESCYSNELFAAMKGGKPQIVAISEKRKTSENHGATHRNYQSSDSVLGQQVKFGSESKYCYSVSTKSGHILIRMNGSGVPKIFVNRDIDQLSIDSGIQEPRRTLRYL